MKPIKMVVTDLDGTLLRNDKTISDYTENVLAELKEQGILFVVATARPIRSVNEWLPFIKYDVGIFHNGAVILDGERRLASIGVEKPAELIRSILAEHPDCQIAAEVNDGLYANFDAGQIWQGIAYVHTLDFAEIEHQIADKLIIKVTTLEAMSQYQKYLPDDLYLQLSEHTIAMIMNKQATKVNAIRLVAEKYGIPMEQVVAFGDDYNDIDMLRGCGIGVAMGNALEEVKQAADETCDTNENDGVARWLRAHLTGEMEGKWED